MNNHADDETGLSLDPVAGVLLLSGVGAWPPPDGVG